MCSTVCGNVNGRGSQLLIRVRLLKLELNDCVLRTPQDRKMKMKIQFQKANNR